MSAFRPPHIAADSPGRASRRDQAARVLLMLAAAGALVAMISAIGTVADAGPAIRMVETWRLLGFGTFAGLFALLAYRPRYYAGVWELAIADKFALALFGFAYGAGTKDASNVLASDGMLALLLVAAYVLNRGWRAWSTLRVIDRPGDRIDADPGGGSCGANFAHGSPTPANSALPDR